jgi:Uri superfamily endonuclease
LRGPVKKTPFWHIDYLLDESAVTLEAVLAVRSGDRLEARLASWLGNYRWTSLLRAGLGAADAPGETHLVRLHGGASAWNTLLREVSELLAVTTNETYLEESWDD